jgi:endonuclease/exonuclease/phosphatase family metal-dependent hydrolase
MKTCRTLLIALAALLLCAIASSAASVRLTAINLDCAQKAINTQQMRSVLLYMQPDIVALHGLPQPAEARGGNASVASLAQSMRMYYAYVPAYSGADFGSALLSRYPIRKPAAISDSPTGRLQGLKAEVRIDKKMLDVVMLRPSSAAEGTYAVTAVSQLLKGAKKRYFLVMASFDSGMALDTVKGLGRAGLQDAAVALRSIQPTYPAASPKERLDFFLVSPTMRPHLKSVKRIKSGLLRGGSDHLPVELAFTF